MQKKPIHIIRRQRRHKKIRIRINGTASRPRLVVYKSNTSIYAQLIDDTNAKTLLGKLDKKDKGKTKVERANNAGKLFAEEALKKGVNSCVFDRNGYIYLGRVKAFADGAREGGLKF
jgi:large subunit ribosomal protein L18